MPSPKMRADRVARAAALPVAFGCLNPASPSSGSSSTHSGSLLVIFSLRTNHASSRATASAGGVRLRVFSHFTLLHAARDAIVGTTLRHGVAIRCCTVSSVVILRISVYPLIVVYLVLVLGLPIQAFQHQPCLLQRHYRQRKPYSPLRFLIFTNFFCSKRENSLSMKKIRLQRTLLGGQLSRATLRKSG